MFKYFNRPRQCNNNKQSVDVRSGISNPQNMHWKCVKLVRSSCLAITVRIKRLGLGRDVNIQQQIKHNNNMNYYNESIRSEMADPSKRNH